MSFAQPSWLFMLILIPILGIGAVITSQLRRKQWAVFIAPRLRGALLKRASLLAHWLALIFLLATCIMLISSLARPQGSAGVRAEKTVGHNVLIALDLSRSMRVTDVKPDRLAQAKMVIYELLDRIPNERIGLIGFAGSAYIYAPLTIDHPAIRETVEQMDENWATRGGSDLAAALHLATETLAKTGQKNNALVIISDGEKHEGDLDGMIAEAEKSGVYILAVGVGTEDGGFVPNPEAPGGKMLDNKGRPVISQMQPQVLRKLATETKGRFAIAGSGQDISQMIESVVKDLDTYEMKGRDRPVSIEFYQWLLLPAIFFLMTSIIAGTRWRRVKTVTLVAGLFLISSNSHANEVSQAHTAFEQKNYSQARDYYHQLAEKTSIMDLSARYSLGEAIAAYRTHDFKGARGAYSRALLANNPEVQKNAHIGIGNSLFQLGWMGLTDQVYPTDSQTLPDLSRFDTIVKSQLEKMRKTPAPEEDETDGYIKIQALITNWTDAIHHFNSAHAIATSDKVPTQNRGLTIVYLKRLQQLLKEEKKNIEEAIPQPIPDKNSPQQGKPGDGESDDKNKDKSGDKKGDKKDSNPKKNEDKGKSGEPKNPNEKNGKKKNELKNDSKNGENDPNESPQDRARRILKENADLEKGPPIPGRREYRDAEKDW
jgi:Ca-activated chloride channel family protein